MGHYLRFKRMLAIGLGVACAAYGGQSWRRPWWLPLRMPSFPSTNDYSIEMRSTNRDCLSDIPAA
jgi:hypothetical protein